MKNSILLLLLAFAVHAQTGPFEVAVSVNHAASSKVFKGWPLIVRADAALTSETSEPVALDPATLRLEVFTASGESARIAFEMIPLSTPQPALSAESDSARAVFLLGAEAAGGLASGTYALRASWGGVQSQLFEIEVVDAPAELSPGERVQIVRLSAEAASLKGDHQAAVALLDEAIAGSPSSIALLSQKASSQIALGRLKDALITVQDALERFAELHPNASHPPVSLLHIQARILDRLTQEPMQ